MPGTTSGLSGLYSLTQRTKPFVTIISPEGSVKLTETFELMGLMSKVATKMPPSSILPLNPDEAEQQFLWWARFCGLEDRHV